MVDSVTFTETGAIGDWGQFNTGHELGHVAHHSRLGGIKGFQVVDNCRDHSLTAEISMGCAAVEGFANF